MQKDKIFLTGATGFLGTVLLRELALCNWDGDFQAYISPRIDITKPFCFSNNTVINHVIHCAGKAHSVPKTEAEKQEFYNVNFNGTKNLCLALEGLGQLPKSFTFISTVAVYGVEEGTNIGESHPLNGGTPYSDSKILAERWLMDWARNHSVTLGILRLPLIVGPDPRGNLRTLLLGIRSGKYLSIGNAGARKSMVWAEDVARIIPAVAEKGGIYNVTDGVHPTFRELETAIASALNKRRPISVPYAVAKSLAMVGDMLGSRFPINSNKLKKITSTLTFDDSKARDELGWTATPILGKINELVNF